MIIQHFTSLDLTKLIHIFRSLCSVVCKWNYDAAKKCWSDDYFSQIGLFDLSEGDYTKLGNLIREPGQAILSGLTAEAAAELGLRPNTKVSTSMIDAHAGALALFGCFAENVNPNLISKMGI